MKFELIKLLKKYEIRNLNFVDVGAKDSIEYIKDLGPLTSIVAFEPNKEEAEKVNKKYEKMDFQSFILETKCLSDVEGKFEFNIMKHASMSSLLEVDIDNYKKNFGSYEKYQTWEKNVEIESKVIVDSTTIDNYFKEINCIDFLKIDTQGSELRILKGALNKMQNKRILIIKVEVSTIPIYKNQALFTEIDLFLRENNYVLVDFLTYREVYTPLFSKILNNNIHYAPCGDAIYILNTADLNESSKIKSALLLSWLGYFSLAKHIISETTLTDEEKNFVLEYDFSSVKTKIKLFLTNICPPVLMYYAKKIFV